MVCTFLFVAALAACSSMPASAQADGPAYDAATIKPSNPGSTGQSWSTDNNRITIRNATLRQLIKVAYGLRSDVQVIGGPDWIGKTHFNIAAKMDDAEFARQGGMAAKEREKESNLLLLHLLEERFQLHAEAEMRSLPQVSLMTDGVTKLKPADSNGGQHVTLHNGQMIAKAVPMESLSAMLSDMPEMDGRVVVDRTGLEGAYNFELNWAPDRGSGIAADATLPGLFTAVREQLGLKLVRGEGDVPVAVVLGAVPPQFD